MSKIIKIVLIVIVIVGLVITGVKKLKEKKASDADAPKAKIYPIVVSQFDAKLQDAKLTLPYLAEVQNDKDVKLASRIAARILSIRSSGSSVKKGEVLIKLDTTTIQSNLQSVSQQLKAATLSLKNLQATHKRTLDLLEIHGASIEESQKESTAIANAQAAISSLKQKRRELLNNLSYATITSPVDGVIAKTFSNQGALSSPGKPLLAISSNNGFYLMVRVPTQLPMQGVIFNTKEYSATPLGSTYHGLAEYKVYVSDQKLTTGDRVEVDVVVFHNKATLLPFDTLLNRDAKSYVLVIKNNQAVAKEVHIIQSAQQGIVVEEDLTGLKLVSAKPDILLRLLSGYLLQVKE